VKLFRGKFAAEILRGVTRLVTKVSECPKAAVDVRGYREAGPGPPTLLGARQDPEPGCLSERPPQDRAERLRLAHRSSSVRRIAWTRWATWSHPLGHPRRQTTPRSGRSSGSPGRATARMLRWRPRIEPTSPPLPAAAEYDERAERAADKLRRLGISVSAPGSDSRLRRRRLQRTEHRRGGPQAMGLHSFLGSRERARCLFLKWLDTSPDDDCPGVVLGGYRSIAARCVQFYGVSCTLRGDLSPTSHKWPNGSRNPP
jgi:hypothetical protein